MSVGDKWGDMETMNVVILGSTGSVGRQALDVIRRLDGLNVLGLAVDTSVEELVAQVKEFQPKAVGVSDTDAAERAAAALKGRDVQVFGPPEGMCELLDVEGVDLVLVAVVGFAGLKPTIKALELGHQVALANKETLVAGGHLVMPLAEAMSVEIRPVDSEHSALWQCLEGVCATEVKQLILTASGGPFRGWPSDRLLSVTPEQALRHPSWDMGAKITIDSATLMNKGLEVIEAHWLYDIGYDRISVVVHPESTVHSLVETVDGNLLAHVGPTDMRYPIQYAFTWPERKAVRWQEFDLTEMGTLTFFKPDYGAFPCLSLAYQAGRAGGSVPAVLNAANEVAVERFLHGKLSFDGIPRLVEGVLERHTSVENPSLERLVEIDGWARLAAADF